MLKNDRALRLQALLDEEDICSIFDLSDTSMETSFTREMDKQDDPGAKIDIKDESPPSENLLGSYEPISESVHSNRIDCLQYPIFKLSQHRDRKDSNHSSESENFERDIFNKSSSDEFCLGEHSSESDQENMCSVAINEPKTPSQPKATIKTALVNVTKSVKKNLRLRPGHLKFNSAFDLSWSNTLEDTLNDPKGFKLFQKFLEQECSSENLSFWTDCQKLDKLHGTEFVKKVIDMYDEYLTEESPQELNVDTRMKLEVANGIIRIPTRDVFDKVLDQIVELMRRDSFRRFQIQVQNNQK